MRYEHGWRRWLLINEMQSRHGGPASKEIIRRFWTYEGAKLWHDVLSIYLPDRQAAVLLYDQKTKRTVVLRRSR